MSASNPQRLVRLIQVVVSGVIVVGVFAFAIPKIADYGEVWGSLGGLTWIGLAALAAVALLNLLAYLPLMVASLPGLSFGQALVNNQACTSVASTLPGGGWIATGVSYSMYRSWGYTNTEIGLSTFVITVWNALVKLGMPLLALAGLLATGRASAGLLLPTVIGVLVLIGAIGLFVAVLWKQGLARQVGAGLGWMASRVRRVFRKHPVQWAEASLRFRGRTISLVSRRWPALTASTLASHTALYLVLLLAIRQVGISGTEIGWAQVLGAFAFVRLISILPITPGGIGLVELTYIGTLYLAGRHHADVPPDVFKAQVAAAVLIFRALTFLLQIPLGGIAYVVWERRKSWRKAVPPEPSLAAVPVAGDVASTTGSV
jgi:putative heme transporter